jgi:hypothetical protein
LLVALMAAAATGPVLARNTLRNGSVSPRSGTTNTSFVFRVDSTGKPNPTSITARLTRSGAAPISIALTKPASGPTWSRSARVTSTGTWTVTFIASNGATGPGGTITVTVPSTPRPSPSPAVATARPATPRPTPKPSRSVKASASAEAPGNTPPATPVAVGGATQPSPSPAPGAGGSADDDAGRILPAVLLGLFVILGVGGIALLTGRRQAEERPSPEPGATPGEPPAPAFVRRAAAAGAAGGAAAASRPRATWEIYSSLENEPLGSVKDDLPDESAEPRVEEANATSGGEGMAFDEEGLNPPAEEADLNTTGDHPSAPRDDTRGVQEDSPSEEGPRP